MEPADADRYFGRVLRSSPSGQRASSGDWAAYAAEISRRTEFDTDKAMLAFRPPTYVIAEVTEDQRFTGGCFATASREHLTSWLADYGIDVDHWPDPANH